MGIVYEAEQEHPRRTVALKIIRPGQTSSDVLRRFELEAEALGRLQHPGIAQIYEAGTADIGFGPQPFFAMELVRGVSPKDYAAAHDLGPRERMEIIAKVADAVQHAHQRGLIHRDLKPGNILVDETGQPKILDFGVARVIDDAQVTLQTGLGQLIGTLAYMSPEQVLADPNELDTRTDVYSMGVILYEVLTGRLPYTAGDKMHEVVQAIREEDPVRLSTISRVFRGDIETIAAKALEKDKTRRYASAGEMAADIRRYLSDEPIVARPPSAVYQLRKFARRHKGFVAATAAVLAALVAGVLVSTFEAARARRERDRAAAAEQIADSERDRALVAQRQAVAAEEQARRERDKAVSEQQRADKEAAVARSLRLAQVWQWLARESLEMSRKRQDDDLAALLARQAMLIHSRTPGQPKYLVEEALQQAAQPPHWLRLLLPASGTVAFSSDGRRIATAADAGVRVWDADNPTAPLITLQAKIRTFFWGIAFSADGTRVAAGDADSVIRVWDARRPDAPPLLFDAPDYYGLFQAIALSPDSTRLAAATENNTVRVWNVQSPGAPPLVLRGPQQQSIAEFFLRSRSIAFSPDSGRLAAATSNTIQVWELSGGAPVTLRGSEDRVLEVAFSADGTRVMAASQDCKVRAWDLRTTNAVPQVVVEAPGSQCESAAFSKNLEKVAVATDKSLRIWDLRNPRRPSLVVDGASTVTSMAFASDGSRLLSAGGAIRMLDLGDSAPERTVQHVRLQSPESTISGVNWPVFSPNLKYLALSVDKSVRVWDVRHVDAAPTRVEIGDFVTSLAFSPDSMRIAAGSVDKSVRVWNLATADVQTLRQAHAGPVAATAFSQDGMRLASLSLVDTLEVLIQRLDRTSGPPSRLELPLPHQFPRGCLTSMKFSPNLDYLACGGTDGRMVVWDLRPPIKPPVMIPGARGSRIPPTGLSFSPDGRYLAVVDGGLRVWDMRNLLLPPRLFAGPRGGDVAAFSPDSAQVVLGGSSDLLVWDMRSPEVPPQVIHGDASSITSIRVSQDGDQVAVFGTLDGAVQVLTMWTKTADYLCTRVSRNLTAAEWRRYVGPDVPYEPTCPSIDARERPAASIR